MTVDEPNQNLKCVMSTDIPDILVIVNGYRKQDDETMNLSESIKPILTCNMSGSSVWWWDHTNLPCFGFLNKLYIKKLS